MARLISTPTALPTTGAPFVSSGGNAGAGDRLVGIVFSNTAGNLYVEQSVNGTDWDYADTIAVTGGTGAKISVELVAAFYRVRYVPTVNPATFRLNVRQSSAGARP